jgi:DNA-binding NtrC family response regulator
MRPLTDVRVAVWPAMNGDLGRVAEAMAGLGCRVRVMESVEELLRASTEGSADLLVLRACPELESVLAALVRREGHPPILVAAGPHDVTFYLEAMRRGAFDGLGLPPDEKEIVRILSQALASRMEVAGPGGVR